MKLLPSLFISLFLVSGFGASGHAQKAAWETLENEVESLYRNGEYDRATIAAKKALEVAEMAGGPDHPDVAESLEKMAAIYRQTGKEREATAMEKRAAAIRSRE